MRKWVVNFMVGVHVITQLSTADYLSISIFLNNDAANILWQFDLTTIDLIIDSNNDSGFSVPEASAAEDKNELKINDPEYPGKIIVIKIADSDKQENDNSLPDFADYDVATNTIVANQFTPIVVYVGETGDSVQNKLVMTYSYSDPGKVTMYGNEATGYQYIPAPGHLRIWTKPAQESRSPASVLDGGDWVPSNTPLPFARLPALVEGKLKFYIESVGLSQQTGDHVIKARLVNGI